VGFDKSKKSKHRFANNRTVPADGVGNVLIKTKVRKQAVISDVLFIHNINSNILSMGQILEKGFSMQMKDCYMEILDSHARRNDHKGTSITKQNFLIPNPCFGCTMLLCRIDK